MVVNKDLHSCACRYTPPHTAHPILYLANKYKDNTITLNNEAQCTAMAQFHDPHGELIDRAIKNKTIHDNYMQSSVSVLPKKKMFNFASTVPER